MSDFGDWFRNVPIFTRYWMAGTVTVTLAGRFGLVDPYLLVLFYPAIKKFQVWRLLTSLLYYPLTPHTGFHFLINVYFLYTYSRRLEEESYSGKPADYLWMLVFNWLACVGVGLYLQMPVLMDPMVLSVLYIWCQLNKDVVVTFWFGTRFKAMYLPWVLLAFNMVISGNGLQELIGILVGHLYFFLKFKYPLELGGPDLLQTPAFVKKYFPDSIGGIRGFGRPPQRPANQSPSTGGTRPFGGHNWGRGYSLNQ